MAKSIWIMDPDDRSASALEALLREVTLDAKRVEDLEGQAPDLLVLAGTQSHEELSQRIQTLRSLSLGDVAAVVILGGIEEASEALAIGADLFLPAPTNLDVFLRELEPFIQIPIPVDAADRRVLASRGQGAGKDAESKAEPSTADEDADTPQPEPDLDSLRAADLADPPPLEPEQSISPPAIGEEGDLSTGMLQILAESAVPEPVDEGEPNAPGAETELDADQPAAEQALTEPEFDPEAEESFEEEEAFHGEEPLTGPELDPEAEESFEGEAAEEQLTEPEFDPEAEESFEGEAAEEQLTEPEFDREAEESFEEEEAFHSEGSLSEAEPDGEDQTALEAEALFDEESPESEGWAEESESVDPEDPEGEDGEDAWLTEDGTDDSDLSLDASSDDDGWGKTTTPSDAADADDGWGETTAPSDAADADDGWNQEVTASEDWTSSTEASADDWAGEASTQAADWPIESNKSPENWTADDLPSEEGLWVDESEAETPAADNWAESPDDLGEAVEWKSEPRLGRQQLRRLGQQLGKQEPTFRAPMGSLGALPATGLLQLIARLGQERVTGRVDLTIQDHRLNLYCQEGRLISLESAGLEPWLLKAALAKGWLDQDESRALLHLSERQQVSLSSLLIKEGFASSPQWLALSRETAETYLLEIATLPGGQARYLPEGPGPWSYGLNPLPARSRIIAMVPALAESPLWPAVGGGDDAKPSRPRRPLEKDFPGRHALQGADGSQTLLQLASRFSIPLEAIRQGILAAVALGDLEIIEMGVGHLHHQHRLHRSFERSVAQIRSGDYFAVLGLADALDSDDVERAFTARLALLRAQVTSRDPLFQELLTELQEARDVLLDPHLRNHYRSSRPI